jgi:hypothetical protein
MDILNVTIKEETIFLDPEMTIPGPRGLGFSLDAHGVYQVGACNVGYTPEGGEVFKLVNRTGAASVQGMAVSFSPDYDDSYIEASNPYIVIGFVYNANVENGDEVWIVRDGVADMLLVDNFAADRDAWLRLSSTVPGRVIAQTRPGYDLSPTSVVYTAGAQASGSLQDLLTDNDLKYEMAEAVGSPGLDAEFVFAVDEFMDKLTVVGYYPGNHAGGVEIQIWDYVALGWVVLGTIPANGATDVVYAFPTLTENMASAGEMKVRLYHPDNGNANHRVYIDQMIVSSTVGTDHFKELGHTMRQAAAGVDTLVRANIHQL